MPEMNWNRICIPIGENACRIRARVLPGARKTEWDGLFDETTLKVRVQARPVEGAANAALVEFISEFLGLKRREVILDTGEKSRLKSFRIEAAAPVVIARLQSSFAT